MAQQRNTRQLRKGVFVLLVGGMLLGCGSSSKVPLDSEALEQFTSFMDQKSFEFRADTAHPTASSAFNAVANGGLLPPGSNSASIQITDISNYIKVYGDSVSGTLPFYGERQLGGGPMSNKGIEFKGVPKTYTQTYNKAKQRYEIDFAIASETGQHEVSMIVFPSKATEVSVTGNQRNLIRYRGKLMALEHNKEE